MSSTASAETDIPIKKGPNGTIIMSLHDYTMVKEYIQQLEAALHSANATIQKDIDDADALELCIRDAVAQHQMVTTCYGDKPL